MELPANKLVRADGKVKLVVSVPAGTAPAVDVALLEGGMKLSVAVPGCKPLTVKLPFVVDETDMKAKFSKTKGQLTVSVPDRTAEDSAGRGTSATSSGVESGATVAINGRGGGAEADSAYTPAPAGAQGPKAGSAPAAGGCCGASEEVPSESDDFRGNWAYSYASSGSEGTHPVPSVPDGARGGDTATSKENAAVGGEGAGAGGGGRSGGGAGDGGGEPTPPKAPLRETFVNHAPTFMDEDIRAEVVAETVPLNLGEDLGPTAMGKRRAVTKRRDKGGGRIEKTYNKRQVMSMAKSLKNYGWAVLDNFVPEDLIETLRDEIKGQEENYEGGEIWVGKEADVGAQISVKSVRGDKILWLDQEELQLHGATTLREMIRAMDRLIIGELSPLADRLSNVAAHTDPMLAIYPGRGSRFAKHIDNTAEDGRRLTALVYLNPGWEPADGGSLRVFPRPVGVAPPVDVLPLAGRLAMFYSDEIAHEVLPTHGERHAVTVWYYDMEERVQSIADAKRHAAERMEEAANTRTRAIEAPDAPASSGGKKSKKKAIKAQEEARAFIQEIMKVGDDASRPNREGVQEVAAAARGMSLGAQEIAAAVVGAPSVRHFQEAVHALTAESLLGLREQIAKMGMD